MSGRRVSLILTYGVHEDASPVLSRHIVFSHTSFSGSAMLVRVSAAGWSAATSSNDFHRQCKKAWFNLALLGAGGLVSVLQITNCIMGLKYSIVLLRGQEP